MAKKIIGTIKLQILAGKATPAPPVGPALGQKGLNIMEFCKAFNAQTSGMPADARIPVVITAYADKTFTFFVTKPPASYYLQKAAALAKGSTAPGRTINGRLTQAQLLEIAKEKMQDMNAYTPEAAASMLAGTARSMGIEVID
jgi:large subunit ribosomal protein L11